MSELIPSRAVTKKDFAYAQLREMIMRGELKAGERIPLRPLADRLKLSVMPVRDALRALELEGFVDIDDHRGASVAQISRDEIIESISLRMWLEVHAIVQSALHPNAGSIARAESALARGERALRSDQGSEFTEANRDFHEAIESGGGDICAAMIKDLWNRLWQLRRSSLFVMKPELMTHAQAEHESILDAVRRGDVAAARLAAEAHRERTLAAWQETLPLQAD